MKWLILWLNQVVFKLKISTRASEPLCQGQEVSCLFREICLVSADMLLCGTLICFLNSFVVISIDRGISGQLPNRSILMLLYVVINQKLNL